VTDTGIDKSKLAWIMMNRQIIHLLTAAYDAMNAAVKKEAINAYKKEAIIA